MLKEQSFLSGVNFIELVAFTYFSYLVVIATRIEVQTATNRVECPTLGRL